MTPLWTSEAIASATGGTASGAFVCDNVCFDSREVVGGELFVALTGESTDGHRFVPAAIERGASGFLVGESIDVPHVRVGDTMAALEALGRAARARTGAKIIGVTGSVGKTGVKEALRGCFERFAPGAAHASVKSYNNHTGVPLSLSRMPAASRFGVFEMGMNHAGELTRLTQLVRPHIAVITWVASAHREFFASEEAIADAKGEIFGGLEPGGVAIVPFDSVHRDRLIGHARPHAADILTFGVGDGADVRALDYAILPDCTTLTADIRGVRLTCKVGMAGRHWLGNALCVLATVQAAGGDLALAGLALADLSDLPGRGKRLRVQRGTSSAVVIDESYNANPASMVAALAVLGEIRPLGRGRKFAVLGAMRELGAGSDDFHAGLAEAVIAAGVERAVLVGDEIKPLVPLLRGKLSTQHVEDVAAALALVTKELGADDVLLVKGSNSVGLGRLVAELQGDMAA